MTGHPFFWAHLYCKFKHCSGTANLRMKTKRSVEVTYNGHVKHKRGETRARPIRGADHEVLSEAFRRGEKAQNMYQEKFSVADMNAVIAGNRDGFGRKKATVSVEIRIYSAK